MALWGNNDNVSVQANATVSLNYDTLEVTGTGTTFGTVDMQEPVISSDSVLEMVTVLVVSQPILEML